MGDSREPCVVLLDGGDGELQQILGLAFVSRVSSSQAAVNISGDEGETVEPSASTSQPENSRSWDLRGTSSERVSHSRGQARGCPIPRPRAYKLKALARRCLERFRPRACACDNHHLQLNEIVPLLFSNDSPVLQEQAARVIVQLSGEEHQRGILKHPRALVGIVQLLFKDDSPNLQIHAALSLANLALAEVDEEEEEQFWFLRYPDALHGLVSLLFKDASTPPPHQRSREITMQVHQEAAMALGNIASTVRGGAMIMENTHALEGLITSLFMHDRRGAQEAATRALVHLAMVEENVQKLLEFPVSIIGSLSGLLLDQSRPSLQENVCRALAFLSSTPESAEKIVRSVHFPRALERLISLLIFRNSSAILPLSNLAINEEIQTIIANIDNILEVALTILTRVGSSSNDQQNTAMLLGNLSLAKANSKKIVECPGFLPAMVDMLFNDSGPDGQEQAAWTLSNLSRAHPGNLLIIMKIADWPGIVGGLIHVLGKEDNHLAQEQAARVLANLSYAPENDPIIARFPDAWTGLIPLLSKSENISLQKEVTRALSNFTSMNVLSQLNVTSECVTSLAKLILEYSSPGFRSSSLESVILEQAALALGNFTLNKSSRWKLAQNDDAVAALMGLLLRFEYPSVQEKAAWALIGLFQDDYLTTVPTNIPQVIPVLRILLSMEQELWHP